MHATQRPIWICLLTMALFGAGCGASTPPESEDSETASESSNPTPNDSADRKSASYYSTLVEAGDGRRFTEGTALVEVTENNGEALVRLSIEASNDVGESWGASLRVPESVITATRANVALDTGTRISTVRRGRPLALRERAALELEREARPLKRPALLGRVDTGDLETTAAFRTEYRVRCLVSPEVIGVTPNGEADPHYDVQPLVEDERFESAFCQKFTALR